MFKVNLNLNTLQHHFEESHCQRVRGHGMEYPVRAKIVTLPKCDDQIVALVALSNILTVLKTYVSMAHSIVSTIDLYAEKGRVSKKSRIESEVFNYFVNVVLERAALINRHHKTRSVRLI